MTIVYFQKDKMRIHSTQYKYTPSYTANVYEASPIAQPSSGHLELKNQ